MKLEDFVGLNKGDIIEIEVSDPHCYYHSPIQATYLGVLDPKKCGTDYRFGEIDIHLLVYQLTEEYVEKYDRYTAELNSIGFPLPIDAININVVKNIKRIL